LYQGVLTVYALKTLRSDCECSIISSKFREISVDPYDDGNWVNVNNFVDSGGWGKEGGECGGSRDQINTRASPIITYRWDNSPDVDIKDFSVREIQVSNIFTSHETLAMTRRAGIRIRIRNFFYHIPISFLHSLAIA
jgi:hypothetical protein